MSPRSAILAVLTLLFAQQGVGAGGSDWAVAVFPSGAEFNLELARTEQERARGYMFRERVGPGEGMLFFMGRRKLNPDPCFSLGHHRVIKSYNINSFSQ